MAIVDPDQRFAVCSFRRVFDTEPKQELLTLEQLLRFLRRFEVKPAVLKRMEREVGRVERALGLVLEGKAGAGPWGTKIREAMRQADKHGSDPVAAAREKADVLANDARRAVKRDLRLWSPALYRRESKRGGENVVHLSCLVLDYDDGTSMEAASATWAPWLHIAHSTWSYRPEYHKFRVALPLAAPIRAEDWPAVYEWASKRTGDVVDPTGRSIGTTFAIPTVGSEDWPRALTGNDGPLLDPVAEGLVGAPAEPPRGAYPPVEESVVTGNPKYRYIQVPVDIELQRVSRNAPDWNDDAMWGDFAVAGDGVASGSESKVAACPPAAARPPADVPPAADTKLDEVHAATAGAAALVDELRSRVADLETQLAEARANPTVAALERVAALHDEGILNADEFELAKRAVLEGE